MRWIDGHCHLDLIGARIGATALNQLVAACRKAGIGGFVVPSVSRRSWESVALLAGQYQGVYPCMGIHPCFLHDYQSTDDAMFKTLGGRDDVVAIGEIGLHAGMGDAQLQRELFVRQVEIAVHWRLPVVVHAYRTYDVVWSVLRKYPSLKGGLIHGFTGSSQQAWRFLDLGLKLGIGGAICWPRGSALRNIVATLPLSSLIIETDSPDMPLPGMAKGENTPLSLEPVFNALCDVREEGCDLVATALLANAVALFGLTAFSQAGAEC